MVLKKIQKKINKFSTFFKDCGIPEEIIAVFKSWVKITPTIAEASVQSMDFYSCFLSYSHQDSNFAKTLHTRLLKNNIQSWFDEEHVFPADNILDAVDHGIRRWDKVLLCCSKNSLNSPWVDREIDKALQKEEDLWRERGQKTLSIIPLNLDGYLFEWENSKASILQSRLAVNFTNWETNQINFDIQLDRLLNALRSDSNARPKVPESKL
ncbi:MAG: pipB2 2 [Segetibacter sp.]|nr:pipB2 2 [Segetibacter sp.]